MSPTIIRGRGPVPNRWIKSDERLRLKGMKRGRLVKGEAWTGLRELVWANLNVIGPLFLCSPNEMQEK